MGLAVRRLPGPADDRARRHDRECRAAVDPERPPLQPVEPVVGRQRLPRHLREPAAPGRPTRRPPRTQARVPRRRRHVHGRIAAVRRRRVGGSVDRCAPAPGHRRGGSSLRDPRDHRHRVPGGRRARPGHERLRLRVGRRRLPRPPRRRAADRGAELALGLLRQPADRRGDVRARPCAHPYRQRARAGAGSRLARLAARHRVAHERDLRDRRGNQLRLDLPTGARRGRPRRGAHGGVPRARGPHREPDHAAAHPPPAWTGQRESRQGLPRHGHVLDVLPRHALSRARTSLQRSADRRGVPALDDHRRRPLAGHHGAARRPVRAASRPHGGHGERRHGAAPVRHRRAGHRVLPDDLPRQLRDRPRHRQRVHATAHACHGRRPGCRRGARLGDHQRCPADQRRARTGGPQHRRRQPHEGTAVRRRRADQLPDRRLPARVLCRSRHDRRRDRARVRAPATAQPATGAATRRSPARPHHPRPRNGAQAA